MMEEPWTPASLFKANPYGLTFLALIVRHKLIMISHRDPDIAYQSSLLILINTIAVMPITCIP